jgi:glycosyltransferase involved in cell wall biosynthesis
MSDFPNSIRLPAPVRITEQVWPEGTVPVVSVFCITYNHVNFIRDAIEGFLMQETTFPVEIFIHDDASTDGTAEIVKEYAEKYPKLFWTVLQTENQWSKGNKKILNDYLQRQRGEFIALCEGDDYWISKEKLQKQVEVLEANPEASLVFHNAEVKNYREGVVKSYIFHSENGKPIPCDTVETKDLLRDWFIPTASIVFRVYSNFQIPQWFNNCKSGDFPLQLILSTYGKFLYLNKLFSVHRLHSGGVSLIHQKELIHTTINRFFMFECFNQYTQKKYEKHMDYLMLDVHLSYIPEYLEMKKNSQELAFLKNDKKRPKWRRICSILKEIFIKK